MQHLSCASFLPFQDSQLSLFLVYQFHSPFGLTSAAAMIKMMITGNVANC